MFKSSNAVFPLLFVCALLNALVSAQSAQTAEARGAYIRYNGTVSARFYQPDCSTYNVAPEKGSTLYVGTYPTWDPNPIFFEIHHIASEDCNQIDCPFDYSPTKAKRQFTILSYDDLSNLWFTSAAYVCYKNGSTCDVGFTWNPYYVVAQLLDLSKATITGTDMLGAPGYVVRGDQETWVSNDTIPAYFDLTLWSSNITSTNRTSKSHCITGDKEYSWNSKENFNYTIIFSNNTATASFFLEVTGGTVEIIFNGTRVDDYNNNFLYFDKDNQPRSINLDTSDPDVPGYVWSTGEKVVRSELWNPPGSSTTSSVPTPTIRTSDNIAIRSSKSILILCWLLTFFHNHVVE